MHICTIITSGGGGKRFSSKIKKQFHSLNGKPILYHSLIPFEKCSLINDIIIVVPQGDEEITKKEIVDKFSLKKVRQVIKGGAERQNSVYNALKVLDKQTDYVIIHDGVRPFVKISEIENIIEEVKEFKAVSLAVPARNTIVKADKNGMISETLKRSEIFEILTPQAFDYNLILSAHEVAIEDDFIATDDSALVKRLDKNVKILFGSQENIKITYESDLKIAQKLIENWSM